MPRCENLKPGDPKKCPNEPSPKEGVCSGMNRSIVTTKRNGQRDVIVKREQERVKAGGKKAAKNPTKRNACCWKVHNACEAMFQSNSIHLSDHVKRNHREKVIRKTWPLVAASVELTTTVDECVNRNHGGEVQVCRGVDSLPREFHAA
jgi:hypothetical protein